MLEQLRQEKYNDYEISKKVEEIIKNSYETSIKMAFNKQPLFLTFNAETINKQLFEGKLEIITNDLLEFFDMPVEAETYICRTRLKEQFAIINNCLIKQGKNRYILETDFLEVVRYDELFEKLKQQESVKHS